jgi:hypothetical protein
MPENGKVCRRKHMSERSEKPIRINGIEGIKEFPNLFDAIQYQKTTAMGRYWIKTPKIVLYAPILSCKKSK